MAKAADAFLTGRPYGIRLDFKHKGFALFNYNMNELGNHLPGRLETLPLEDFDVEDIPLCGERIVRKENITDIFFYDEKSNPYSDNRVDMKKLKAYNKYIYPLSLILNRNQWKSLGQRFLCYFLCPPSAHRKKVGRLSPPLPKVGCKVPLHP